jgi:hypothetical protein
MSFKPTSVPTKRLAGAILSTDMAFRVDNILGWDGEALVAGDFGTQGYGVFRDSARTRIEIFEFDPTTIASSEITIVKRGLQFDGDRTTEVTANQFDWTAGDTYVDLGTDTPQALQYFQDYIDALAIAGSPTASTTTQGLVEEATEAEVLAGTATGGTGARLFVNPEHLDAYTANTTNPVVRTYLNAGSPHTWTKPAGLKYAVVEVQAAGGDGESVTITDGGGGGGGGGGYGKKLIAVASLGATETVTVGAVGATSSFGAHVVATNGTTATTEAGAAGGGCTGGDINITGGTGGTGSPYSDDAGHGGPGGDSFLGTGGALVVSGSNGVAGTGYGGGGSGGAASGTIDRTGGAGGPGIVIVTEFYN